MVANLSLDKSFWDFLRYDYDLKIEKNMISGPVNCKPGLLSRGSISAFGSKPNSVALSLVSNIGMPSGSLVSDLILSLSSAAESRSLLSELKNIVGYDVCFMTLLTPPDPEHIII